MMKNLLLVVCATFAFGFSAVTFAGDDLPEIAPVDEVTYEPLPDFVPAK